MKIIFLLPHLKMSGGVRVMFSYANELAKNGHEVIVSSECPSGFRNCVYNRINRHDFLPQDSNVRIFRVKNFIKDLPCGDVFIADSYSIALTLYEMRTAAKKIHFIQHDEKLYHGDAEKVKKSYALPLKKVVVSSWLKEILLNEYGQKSEFLLNSTDKKLFYPVDVKRNHDCIRILILNHHYAWKGTEEGVGMVQELKKKHKIILALLGTRERKPSFPCDEYYYNIPQKKMARLYSSADIYLCPSWDEGSGLPSMEAMACKCALATYDNGGSRDYAIHQEMAMVAKRRDTADLKAKLEMLVADCDLRNRIAENGYRHISRMPTWQEQAEKLEKIILE